MAPVYVKGPFLDFLFRNGPPWFSADLPLLLSRGGTALCPISVIERAGVPVVHQ
jgi:hypothetical protein